MLGLLGVGDKLMESVSSCCDPDSGDRDLAPEKGTLCVDALGVEALGEEALDVEALDVEALVLGSAKSTLGMEALGEALETFPSDVKAAADLPLALPDRRSR